MAFLLTIFNSSGGFVQKKLQLIFVKPRAEGERADRGVVGDHATLVSPAMAGFTEVGGLRPPPSRRGERVGAGRYVAAGGLGWRERLISQAPQLGRMGGALSSPPVYAARSPRPADARRWVALRSEPGITSARTLRGSEGATPSGRKESRRGGYAVFLRIEFGRYAVERREGDGWRCRLFVNSCVPPP